MKTMLRQVSASPLRSFFGALSVAIALCLLIWSVSNYRPATSFYGPRAIYSLVTLTCLIALLGRILLLRLLRSELAHPANTRQQVLDTWRPLFLFDITAPFYLAASVLISVPAAVLTAIITQIVLQGYTLLRGFISWSEACYRLGSTALLAFISGQIFVWTAGGTHLPVHQRSQVAEGSELLGSVVAALAMLVCIALISLPVVTRWQWPLPWSAWRSYLTSPFLRFQALVLSVGPLLPVVDIFDNAVAELAWCFFLVPLFAIYYLALVSTRLSIQTSELQRTLEDLRSARRRQDELRDYASLITRVQEEERRRLARELHDDTAQALIALSLGLDGLGRAMRQLQLPQKDLEWHASLQNLADRTLEGVRRACRDLRPSVLDDLGLHAALEWLSDSSAERGVPCTFSCSGEPRPTSPEAEIAIFRIAQEALSNVWRHSQASQACLTLQYLPDRLLVSVSDNGRGFAPDQPTTREAGSQGGLGLLGMRERAALIGASLSIHSSPGQGCTVTLSLPF
jgi:signal transduction histidine kinase